MNPKPCKHCKSELHTSLKCFKAPRKPIKRPVGASKVKKVRVPKKKPMSRSQLVKRLDSVFSQYVRLRDDGNGCVTCGDKKPWKEMQACHFYTRGRQATRWHESNVFSGCYRCNVLLKGNYINYTRYMIDRFGREFVDQLEYESLNGAKISTPELREKIAYYKGKVAELSTSKHDEY